MNCGEVEPYTATSGRFSAAATCIRPESLLTTAPAQDIRSMASARLVAPARLTSSSRNPGIRRMRMSSPPGWSFFEPNSHTCQPARIFTSATLA
ncbi:hypothetical protein D9M68_923630 [compost metagenome]